MPATPARAPEASSETRTLVDAGRDRVDDVILGCLTPIGDQGADIARFAALHADWDVNVPGMQINRFCASGLETVNLAARCGPRFAPPDLLLRMARRGETF